MRYDENCGDTASLQYLNGNGSGKNVFSGAIVNVDDSLAAGWSESSTVFIVNDKGEKIPVLVYTDVIGDAGAPPLLGIGGTRVIYAVTSERFATQDNMVVKSDGPITSAGPESGAATTQGPWYLPIHPGQMTMQILDMNGNSINIGADGNIIGRAEALAVDSTGRVQIRYRGVGVDEDDWILDINRIIPKAFTGSNGEAAVVNAKSTLAGQANVSYPYPRAATAATSYIENTVSVGLAFGTNNFQIGWYQKQDLNINAPNATYFQSTYVALKYSKRLGGGYSLRISTSNSPTVDTDDNGALVVAPGQPLNFNLSINQTDPSDANALNGVTWDFGDQSLVQALIAKGKIPASSSSTGNGGSASHSYHQAPGQVGATPPQPYTITIHGLPWFDSGSEPTIPVIVQDTQDGPLYESETWNGDHTVAGNVIVPMGTSLTIGTMAPTTVKFLGGLAAGLNQGLTVQDTLLVGTTSLADTVGTGIPVTFEPDPVLPSATGQSWGAIYVMGGSKGNATATIVGATIEGGDRGVATGPSVGSVTLVSTTLTGNNIGIQVDANSSTTVNACTISGNEAYGVKEDDGGHPVVLGTSFSGNGVDYYQYGLGGITIDELNNASLKNSGNTRVQP